MMISSDQITLFRAFQNASEDQQGQHLDIMVQSMGEQAFCHIAAEHLVTLARPEMAVPDSLVDFVPLVRDGITFFLSKLSYPRLRKAILSQARLPVDSEIGERLLDLSLCFPTLHKFGQIVARNPELDPKLKKWLIRLEKGHYRSDISELKQQLIEWLAQADLTHRVFLASDILAEASVAAIIPFTCETNKLEGRSEGVFKVLKPKIKEHLMEELLVLRDVAVFFENNRKTYDLQEMMVVDLFNEVHEDLVREVDLMAEQKNMAEAEEIYFNVQNVMIPELFSFCTPTITAMDLVDGIRITDVEMSQKQRASLARLTFETIICMPLFSIKDRALFHGDPHAGNILAVTGKHSEDFGIALVDWTLAGYLTRSQRGHIVEMMVGIMTDDVRRISEAIHKMINGKGPKSSIELVNECVTGFFASKDHWSDPLKMAFNVMAKLTLDGFVLPSELILFRKAFFTLEGVLNDISPGFSMSETMENYLGRLVLAEVPLRISSGFLPIPDRALDYRTMLSNRTLGDLSFYQTLSVWNKAMVANYSLLGSQTKIMADFLSCLCGGQFFKNRG